MILQAVRRPPEVTALKGIARDKGEECWFVVKMGCETLFKIPLSLAMPLNPDFALNILCHTQHFIQRRRAFQNFFHAILS